MIIQKLIAALIIAMLMTTGCGQIPKLGADGKNRPVGGTIKSELETKTVDAEVSNYEEYSQAVKQAIEEGKAKLEIRVSNYNKEEYDDKPARAGNQYNAQFSGFSMEGSYAGKTAVLTYKFSYFTAEGSGNNLIPDTYAIPIGSFDEYSKEVKKALGDFKNKITLRVKNSNEEYSLQVINKHWSEEPLRYSNGISVESSIISDGSGSSIMVIGITYSDANGNILQPETMRGWRDAAHNASQAIISSVIKAGMTDLQKEKALHDYIVKKASYKDQGPQSYMDYGVLVEGVGVCESYAKAMYRLLSMVNIPVKLMDGVAGGEPHQWNMVQIGGKWYHLDATWNDPVGAPEGYVSHKYFNISEAEIRKTHSW